MTKDEQNQIIINKIVEKLRNKNSVEDVLDKSFSVWFKVKLDEAKNMFNSGIGNISGDTETKASMGRGDNK